MCWLRYALTSELVLLEVEVLILPHARISHLYTCVQVQRRDARYDIGFASTERFYVQTPQDYDSVSHPLTGTAPWVEGVTL